MEKEKVVALARDEAREVASRWGGKRKNQTASWSSLRVQENKLDRRSRVSLILQPSSTSSSRNGESYQASLELSVQTKDRGCTTVKILDRLDVKK